MDINQQKEQFTSSYLLAVASVAGFSLYEPRVDDDSIDWVIAQRGGGGTTRSPRLELQLKGSHDVIIDDEVVRYDLKVKNYNELRYENVAVPRILLLVVVPEQQSAWLEWDEDKMIMRRCGYWLSLRGAEPPGTTTTKRVEIPRTQQFNPESLRQIMKRLADGGLP